jgi:hypothetical protein
MQRKEIGVAAKRPPPAGNFRTIAPPPESETSSDVEGECRSEGLLSRFDRYGLVTWYRRWPHRSLATMATILVNVSEVKVCQKSDDIRIRVAPVEIARNPT